MSQIVMENTLYLFIRLQFIAIAENPLFDILQFFRSLAGRIDILGDIKTIFYPFHHFTLFSTTILEVANFSPFLVSVISSLPVAAFLSCSIHSSPEYCFGYA